MPTATQGEASIEIMAPPNLVYDELADVTRMGERSPECYRCEWVAGVTGPAVGARFKGFNQRGPIRWSTTCVVTRVELGREFAFTVLSGRDRPETEWRYVISASAAGCTVTESYQFLWCPWLARIAEVPFPRDRQLRRGLSQTLARIKESAEAARVPS